MPMCLIQYMNNDLMKLWSVGGLEGLMVYLNFVTSVITVGINLVKVVTTLFDKDIIDYYGLLLYLEEKTLHDIEEKYHFPEQIEIATLDRLHKLTNIKRYSLQHTPSIKFTFPDQEKLGLRKIEYSLIEK